MAANNSLKNNRAQLAKRKSGKSLSGSYSEVEIKTFPKATEEELLAIKAKMDLENRKLKRKQHITFFIVLAVVAVLLWLYMASIKFD